MGDLPPSYMRPENQCVVCGLYGEDPIPGDLLNLHQDVNFNNHPHWQMIDDDESVAYLLGYAVGLGLVDPVGHEFHDQYTLGVADGKGDANG